MKKYGSLIPFLLFVAFSNVVVTDCIAQENIQSIEQLNKKMNSFMGRVRVYAKCLRGKCTKEEQKMVTKAVLKDGSIMVAAVGAIIGGAFLVKRYGRAGLKMIKRGLSKSPVNTEKIKEVISYIANDDDPRTKLEFDDIDEGKLVVTKSEGGRKIELDLIKEKKEDNFLTDSSQYPNVTVIRDYLFNNAIPNLEKFSIVYHIKRGDMVYHWTKKGNGWEGNWVLTQTGMAS